MLADGLLVASQETVLAHLPALLRAWPAREELNAPAQLPSAEIVLEASLAKHPRLEATCLANTQWVGDQDITSLVKAMAQACTAKTAAGDTFPDSGAWLAMATAVSTEVLTLVILANSATAASVAKTLVACQDKRGLAKCQLP